MRSVGRTLQPVDDSLEKLKNVLGPLPRKLLFSMYGRSALCSYDRGFHMARQGKRKSEIHINQKRNRDRGG